jgi:hypothetical protein
MYTAIIRWIFQEYFVARRIIISYLLTFTLCNNSKSNCLVSEVLWSNFWLIVFIFCSNASSLALDSSLVLLLFIILIQSSFFSSLSSLIICVINWFRGVNLFVDVVEPSSSLARSIYCYFLDPNLVKRMSSFLAVKSFLTNSCASFCVLLSPNIALFMPLLLHWIMRNEVIDILIFARDSAMFSG